MTRLTSRGTVPNFSIVYALPVGGQREHCFDSAHDLADHVQANQPGLFSGTPKLDDKYEENMDKYCRRGYRLPSDSN